MLAFFKKIGTESCCFFIDFGAILGSPGGSEIDKNQKNAFQKLIEKMGRKSGAAKESVEGDGGRRAAEMNKIVRDFGRFRAGFVSKSSTRPATPGGVRRIQSLRAFRRSPIKYLYS